MTVFVGHILFDNLLLARGVDEGHSGKAPVPELQGGVLLVEVTSAVLVEFLVEKAEARV